MLEEIDLNAIHDENVRKQMRQLLNLVEKLSADLRALQELLGHQSLSSTEKYTHVTTKDLQKMYDTLHPINSMMAMLE